MRAKNLFGMKNLGRVVAFALAGVMAFGGIAPMRAQATDGATGVLYPQYIGGVYQYNAGDIFGAATHVHLFGNKVTTSAHTHGNIMAEKRDIQ